MATLKNIQVNTLKLIKSISTVGANRLEMHCKHKRVFEGGNRVRKKPEETQKEREKEEEEEGGDVRLRITSMSL